MSNKEAKISTITHLHDQMSDRFGKDESSWVVKILDLFQVGISADRNESCASSSKEVKEGKGTRDRAYAGNWSDPIFCLISLRNEKGKVTVGQRLEEEGMDEWAQNNEI